MLRRSFFSVLSVAALAIAPFAHADDAEAIVKRAIGKDALGLEGGHALVAMTITADDGSVETKSFEIWAKKQDGLLRTVVRFKSPAKIAGTAFLLLQRKGAPDEQWIYLPAYKKARRITSKERGAAFAGSDFTYADLERRALDDATYKKLPEETIGKDACAVVEATPKDGVYGKVVGWLRKTDDVPLRTQFFGEDGKLAKTLFTKKIKPIDGKPIVVESRMEKAGSKHATDLRVDDVTFKTDVPDSFFTVGALEGG
ncbi:MAG: outer membrane lipoprotein-sorting protein [Polyangiales bacterium]